MVRLNYFLQ